MAADPIKLRYQKALGTTLIPLRSETTHCTRNREKKADCPMSPKVVQAIESSHSKSIFSFKNQFLDAHLRAFYWSSYHCEPQERVLARLRRHFQMSGNETGQSALLRAFSFADVAHVPADEPTPRQSRG